MPVSWELELLMQVHSSLREWLNLEVDLELLEHDGVA